MSPFAGLALALYLLGTAAAMAQGSAEDAYQRKDFAAAREQWLKAAQAGSAQAKLGLGLLADRGLGEARDPVKAFNWYLDAAVDGLPEAQFNVGVMLDAGVGTTRNLNAALVWYSRAALRGHPRAQYNLGLLFADGEGLPSNVDLAAFWFRQAADVLPAAQGRLDELKPGAASTAIEPPTIFLAQFEAPKAELVWSAPFVTGAAGFQVEIVPKPTAGDYRDPVLNVVTDASALLTDDLPDQDGLRLRISQLLDGGADYVAGPWLGGEAGEAPKGRVDFIVKDDDVRMTMLATVLAADLRQAGYWVRLTPAPESPDGETPTTSVTYSYESDKALAGQIADFLPVLSAKDAVQAPPRSTLPGEIRVNLAEIGRAHV